MVLQRYISQLILGYVKKYISNLEASVAFSLWGGDMLFNNLDIRLDVLQQSLGMPAAFSLSRGFIKELRLHIPWAAITTQPVQVTFTGVECVLVFNPKARDDATQSAAADATPPSTPRVEPGAAAASGSPAVPTSGSSAAAADEEAEAGGGWASDLITKIIANLSITVHDLSLKYVEGSACACLRLQSLSLHSTDPSWRSSDFMDLLGPWKLIHKLVSIQHVSLFLYPDDGQQAPVKNEQVCILQLNISARIKSYLAALGATADISSWSTNALATAVTPASLLPSSSSAVVASSSSSSTPSSSSAAPPPLPPNAKALPRPLPPPCGPAITVDIHVTEAVDLMLSSYQFERLHSIIQSKSDFYATSAAAARVAQSIAAAPAVIARQDQQHQEQQKRKKGVNGDAPDRRGGSRDSTAAVAAKDGTDKVAAPDAGTAGEETAAASTAAAESKRTTKPAAASKGWMSWMWELVAAEEEEDEDTAASRQRERDGRVAARDFQRVMGHLAPSDEIIFCFHIAAIALHIRSDRQPELEAADDDDDDDEAEKGNSSLPSFRELSGDRVVSSSSAPSPPRSYPLEPSQDALVTTISLLDTLSASTTTAASSSALAESFASLTIHDLGMILSQPLLLSSKPAAAMQRDECVSPHRDHAPPSPLSSSPAAEVKPPTFCCNVVSVSISVVDSPSASPRAVLRFGPEISQSSPSPTHAAQSSRAQGPAHELHVSKVRKRIAPFTAASCLHRNKYWDRVAEAGEQQHWLYALSIYHTVKTVDAAAAGASPFSSDSSLLSPSSSSSVRYATCFDVLLGPLSLSVDWSSAGTERLIAQLNVFLKTMQSIAQEEEEEELQQQQQQAAAASSSPPPCWLQLKCAVPSCDGFILGNPCPGHGEGRRRCRKSVVTRPCQHYSAHAEVACLPY